MTLPRYPTRAIVPDKPIKSVPIQPLSQIILSYIENEREDDPVIQIKAGVWAKRSNVEGISIDGIRYYYAILPHASFDPLSRGEVSLDDIHIVQEITEGDFKIIIYTIGPIPNAA